MRSNRVRRMARAAVQELESTRKRLKRWLWPGAPNAKALVGMALVPVAVVLVLVFLGYWKKGEDACHGHELTCGLTIHLVGTFLAAGFVYYLIFLRREARAARRWRTRARKEPETLFESLPPLDGLTGEAQSSASLVRRTRETDSRFRSWNRRRRMGNVLLESIVGRDPLVKELAADLEEVGEPRILVAASGSGKTMVLVKLAERLAHQGQVPIPVSLRGVSKLNFEDLARTAWAHHADVHHDEVEHQWQWLRKRNRITVLADELEKSKPTPAQRAQAIEAAARAGLRLVITSRPDGLPSDYRRGLITLERLDRTVVVEDLCDRLAPDPADRPRITSQVEALVDRAEITETPYYLAAARVLAALGALDNPPEWQDARLYLAETYREAVADCRVRPDAGLTSTTRRLELKRLEAVACARLFGARTEADVAEKIGLLDPDSDVDVHACVSAGIRLGVMVDRFDDRVRFGHPTTVAYFASRFVAERPKDERLWNLIRSQEEISPLLSLALAFAGAAARDHEMSERILNELLARVDGTGRRAPALQLSAVESGSELPGPSATATTPPDRDANGDGASHQMSPNGTGEFERLGLIATAADVLRFDPSPAPAQSDAVVGAVRSGDVQSEDVALAQRRAVRAIGKLRTDAAFRTLWSLAANPGEYVLRRAAARALGLGGSATADALAHDLCETIGDAERCLVSGIHDGRDPRLVTEATKAAAWILPSLRSAADEDHSRQLGCLDEAQQRLAKVARKLTEDRGIEASVAQGLKSDAIRRPRRAVDEIAMDMLRDGESRASFWFSRVLAVQAITRRCICARGPARKEAQQVVRQAKRDGHPFVRETARLCLRAIEKEDWHRFQWDDVTDIAAGVPHKLVIDATRLVGDIVLALNLNEYGERHARRAFGESNKLPACLSQSPDRLEILGSVRPPTSCEFAKDGPCFCPYRYEPPEDGIRRELSRAFCRHQRLTARQPPWQPEMSVRQVKRFWADMEDLARF